MHEKHAILMAALVMHQIASADVIVVSRAMKATTIAEIFIESDVIHVEMEIGVSDLDGFRNLMPDEIHERLGHEPVPLQQRLVTFCGEDLVIRADGGAPIAGEIVELLPRTRIRRDEITGEPLPVDEENAELVVFARLAYPLDGHPAHLSIKPPTDPANGFVGATIGFVTYHHGLPINDFRYLGREETLDLDWDDPWHSRFRSRQLRRAFDAPMNVFLYVEPYEVRVEVIVRPLDVQQWIDLGLPDRGTISPEMYSSIQGRVAEFLAENLNLTIDGEPVEPVLDRINFLRRTLRTSTVIDPPEELSVFMAQLGAIFIVPRDQLPQDVELTWELFSERIQAVPGAATDEAGPMPSTLTRDDNVLRWKNFLLNPTVPTMVGVEAPPRRFARLLPTAGWGCVLGLVALLTWGGMRFVRARTVPWPAAAALVVLVVASGALFRAGRATVIDQEQSERIVGTLLHNVYRAFDYRKEGAVYDALARSVTGDLLTQVYLETRRSLELRNQGGAQVKVNDVEVVECRLRPAGGGIGFVVDCRWNVTGSVGHWGHIHQRRNQYNAVVTIRAVDGAWRITGMELISEERL